MRIKAASRLTAMYIRRGDNYPGGAQENSKLLKCDTAYSRILTNYGDMVFLETSDHEYDCQVFLLCKIGCAFSDFKAHWEESDRHNYHDSLKCCGAIDVIGHIQLDREEKPQMIGSLFINKKYRNRGFGRGLYIAAHQFTAGGIKSSNDLGTMSFATWLSLYRDYPKIQFYVGSKLISRNDLIIKGTDIRWVSSKGLVNLTSSKNPEFTFVWR